MVEHTLRGCITAAVLLKLIAGLVQCSCLLKLPTVSHRIDNGTAAVKQAAAGVAGGTHRMPLPCLSEFMKRTRMPSSSNRVAISATCMRRSRFNDCVLQGTYKGMQCSCGKEQVVLCKHARAAAELD